MLAASMTALFMGLRHKLDRQLGWLQPFSRTSHQSVGQALAQRLGPLASQVQEPGTIAVASNVLQVLGDACFAAAEAAAHMLDAHEVGGATLAEYQTFLKQEVTPQDHTRAITVPRADAFCQVALAEFGELRQRLLQAVKNLAEYNAHKRSAEMLYAPHPAPPVQYAEWGPRMGPPQAQFPTQMPGGGGRPPMRGEFSQQPCHFVINGVCTREVMTGQRCQYRHHGPDVSVHGRQFVLRRGVFRQSWSTLPPPTQASTAPPSGTQ